MNRWNVYINKLAKKGTWDKEYYKVNWKRIRQRKFYFSWDNKLLDIPIRDHINEHVKAKYLISLLSTFCYITLLNNKIKEK